MNICGKNRQLLVAANRWNGANCIGNHDYAASAKKVFLWKLN
jgi:hypothetical protein